MKGHWAYSLIGRPWSDRENCWWLVRYVFETRHGIQMPAITVGDFAEVENVAAIKRAAEASGWRRVIGVEPQEDDIVLMHGPKGRHVGVMIRSSQGLRMLHSDGFNSVRGPVGSVVAQSLKDMLANGYSDIELWRRS